MTLFDTTKIESVPALWQKCMIMNLIGEDAITLEDLGEFSEEVQERVRCLVERWFLG